MKNKRVVIDTNIWISFLISKNFKGLDSLITSGQITLLFSTELIEEFFEVANRPKFKSYFRKRDLESLLAQLENIGELISVTTKTNTCRDSKDNFLLSLSKDGKADFLLTGDEDLLELKNFGSTRIIRWSEFIKIAN
jgi:uncharacterized protein